MATIFVFLYMGCTLAPLANTTEPSVCQITLATYCYYYWLRRSSTTYYKKI